MDHEQQTRSAIESAREAHEKGKQFLRKTLAKRRKEEALAGKKHRLHLDKRIKAILSLKQNIDSSQGTIQALQVLKSEQNKKIKELEKRERERIVADGGNPEEVFLRRQRADQFEKERQKFKEQQDQRQLEIVTRLLEEERVQKRLKKDQSKSHWHGRQKTKPHPSKKNLVDGGKSRRKRNEVDSELSGTGDERDGDEGEGGDGSEIEVTFEDEDKVRRPDKGSSSSDEGDGSEKVDDITLEALDEENLLEPEIKGLWETAPVIKKKESVHADVGEARMKREKSKAEIEMMQRAMEKLKKSAIITQVAGGREFKV